MKVNVGAKRLGDESKIKQKLHGFDRANFNLNRKWRTTMNVGTLVPCYKELVTAGTTIELNEKNDVKTLPTVGPLFGSFKLQTDYFFVPIRLYISALHNNQLNIGLNMSSVKLPKLMIENADTQALNGLVSDNANVKDYDFRKLGSSSSNILHYMGYKGGIKKYGQNVEEQTNEYQYNKINAIPLLGYYDIFKNYYANKQEEYCYMSTGTYQIMGVELIDETDVQQFLSRNYGFTDTGEKSLTTPIKTNSVINIYINKDAFFTKLQTQVEENLQTILERVYVDYRVVVGGYAVEDKRAISLWDLYSNKYDAQGGVPSLQLDEITEEEFAVGPIAAQTPTIKQWQISLIMQEANAEINRISWRRNVTIEGVPLTIFDEIREGLLTKPFNQEMNYLWNNGNDSNQFIGRLGKLQNYTCPLEGLMVKTYQSDLLNNWMNTEWLDGENGINAVTAISTEEGSFDINSLIVARKTFDMLNRIAMSDGDYKGWQQAVYDHNGRWNIEQPLYVGGFSEDIVFQEVVSNAATENEPLGTLAGRGTSINQRGDKVYFKADEAGYILGVTSITPRLDYSDGQDWDVSLDNMNDLHKPNLDGIGFQDLNTKQAAWWDGSIQDIYSFGKQVAWQNYMTTINQVHGEFALNGDYDWMILQRKYHAKLEDIEDEGAERYYPYIADRTTYINPNDWTGIFADERDDGQNFWVQKAQLVDMRRIMAAKQIPNL